MNVIGKTYGGVGWFQTGIALLVQQMRKSPALSMRGLHKLKTAGKWKERVLTLLAKLARRYKLNETGVLLLLL
jgi:hypothetical protein